jgi:hypothetical protein
MFTVFGPSPFIYSSLLQEDGMRHIFTEQLWGLKILSSHGEIVIWKSGVHFGRKQILEIISSCDCRGMDP